MINFKAIVVQLQRTPHLPYQRKGGAGLGVVATEETTALVLKPDEFVGVLRRCPSSVSA